MAAPEEISLFCIPHAGGSAAYYTKFGDFFPDSVRLRPLELPGRGRRCREPLLTSLEALGLGLFEQMAPAARAGPYAIFGHSMGAWLAFICARLAPTKGAPRPTRLFVSAADAPGRRPRNFSTPVSSLPPGELWNHVVRLGGVPDDLADSDDFRRYLEPVLFADFLAFETWRPQTPDPLPVPITVFLGREDRLAAAEAKEHWAQVTTRECSVHSYPGHHFYLQEHWKALAGRIMRALFPATSPVPGQLNLRAGL